MVYRLVLPRAAEVEPRCSPSGEALDSARLLHDAIAIISCRALSAPHFKVEDGMVDGLLFYPLRLIEARVLARRLLDEEASMSSMPRRGEKRKIRVFIISVNN